MAGALALLLLAASLVLIGAGGTVAMTASNALKRVVGAAMAQSGAALGALALGAPEAVALGGLAAAFAALMLGAAIAVRMQEAYAAVESGAVDAADLAAEPDDVS